MVKNNLNILFIFAFAIFLIIMVWGVIVSGDCYKQTTTLLEGDVYKNAEGTIVSIVYINSNSAKFSIGVGNTNEITNTMSIGQTYQIDGATSLILNNVHYLSSEGNGTNSVNITFNYCPTNKTVIHIEPNETTGPLEINSTFNESDETGLNESVVVFCNGCELGNKCYPFGYRKSSNFCSDSGSFVEQLKKDAVCENNFECSSNLCIDGNCVSSSLIQQIINWFKNLFS
ncbi:hypothetical protein AUJ10_01260 [Candidatus Pacearchaeota archaeon CG1_02_31_27]|nr:MAG: hypothetical protein AUJ10_01260 [Candidatus Pacearchaeota archaeon CG1_02_31_27]